MTALDAIRKLRQIGRIPDHMTRVKAMVDVWPALLDIAEAADAYRKLIESPTEPPAARVEKVYLDLFAALDRLTALGGTDAD